MKNLKTYQEVNEKYFSRKDRNDKKETRAMVELIKKYVKDNWDNETTETNDFFGGKRMTKKFPLKKGYFIDYFRDVRGDLYEIIDENGEKVIQWVHNKYPMGGSDINDLSKDEDLNLSVLKFILGY